MPVPLSNVVQRRHISESKRRRSLHVPLSPLHRSSDNTPEVYHPPSLFDRLPVELQIQIVTHCLPPFPRFDPTEAPILISRVSRTWRSLVLSVPKLWSSFVIQVTGSVWPTLLCDSDSHIERSMKLWLARSKNYPLTVSIIHVPVTRETDNRSARLLALLMPEAHRWRSVQIIVPTSNMIPLPTHFPSLQQFSLQMKGRWKSEPSLNVSSANIPWYQLSHLDLQMENNHLPTLGDTLSILSHTSRLRLCRISVDCTLDSDVDFDNLHLPVLEELHLILHGGNSSGLAASSLTRFLHHISMPILRALNIMWFDHRPMLWSDFHLFVAFLRRISSTLRSLSLAYLVDSESDLIDVLTPFSNVTHLHLRFSLSDRERDPVSDNLLSLLTPLNNGGHHPLLPSLVSLDLQCNGSKFSNSALLAMLKSRWKKDAETDDRFVHFNLLSMKPTLREVEKQVKMMNGEGLDISVQTLLVR